MAGTLAIIANLAQETTFINRVKAAMVTAGISIAAEGTTGLTSTVYQKRHQLAVAVLNAPDVYVSRFAWAAATNSTIAGEVGNPVAISSSTAANPSVITTGAAHGYTTGDQVTINGHTVNPAINGCWTVTVLTSTTFSVPVLGTGAGGATGTAVKQPPDSDVQFAVNSDWNDIAGVGVTD